MSQPVQLDGRTFAIGILSVTACILFVGLLLIATARPAGAIGMNDRSGDYIIVTQQLTNSTEGVVVMDAASKRMIVYAYDFNRKQLLPLSSFELNRLPAPGAEAPPQRRP